MIPYYKEIESKEFPLYLKNSFGRTKYVGVQDVRLPDWFFNKYSLLFEKVNILYTLIPLTSFDTIVCNTYEDWLALGNLISTIDSNISILYYYPKPKIEGPEAIEIMLNEQMNLDYEEYISEPLPKPITFNGNDEYWLLKLYSDLASSFKRFFPQLSDILEFIYSESKKAVSDLHKLTTIKVVPEKYVEINWPDAWFITPSGHLYNSGRQEGHKEGNFINYFHELNYSSSMGKKIYFPLTNLFNKKAKEIREKGYCTNWEYTSYANLIYTLISIDTPETEFATLQEESFSSYLNEIKRKNKVVDTCQLTSLALNKEELEKYFFLNSDLSYGDNFRKKILELQKQVSNDNIEEFKRYEGPLDDLPEQISKLREKYFKGNDPQNKRCYQKNIVTLVAGYLNAKNDLFDSLVPLNASKRANIMVELFEKAHYSWSEVLVRFCGFSKIDRTYKKTIITSRLDAYKAFRNYLEKGWEIMLVSPLRYNPDTDQIEEISLYSVSALHSITSQEERNIDYTGRVYHLR